MPAPGQRSRLSTTTGAKHAVIATWKKKCLAGRKFAAVASGALVIALGACSFLPDRQVLLPGEVKQADPQPSTQREHLRILAAYGGAYDDPKLQTLISQTVERLVAATERPELHYKVTLLNSPAVNAFALPTGQLYVTRGLAALANDNAELASVLAHEMAHVIARHAAIREEQARQAATISRVDSEADPQSGALALAKTKIALATFSRAQEFEADGIGVGMAARAGYDPFGAARFLTSMGRNADLKSATSGGDQRSLDFLSSHPTTPERVKNAQSIARQYVIPGAPVERDKSTFLASIEGLVYGDDPSEGFVRGRRFLHPRLGFTFTAPEGFTLDNTAQAVLGLREGGGAALRLDVVRIPPEQGLSDYLMSGWIEHVDRDSLEELTVDGLPAATALAKGDDWSFRLYAIRFGNEAFRFIFANKHDAGESDQMFRASIGTFRRMTAAEISAAKPLRLKITEVMPGDTVERLAAHMGGLDHAVERFRVLNGLDAAARLKPGDQVKTLTE
jgi:predicted Zn-dependent protease